MKALIVDDHELVRHGLALIVKDSFDDAEVAEAGNADEALKAMESNDVDIALLDVRLPGTDGIQLLKQIKTRWKDTPVIMLTTYDHAQYARASLTEGAAGYMLKDSSPALLSQAMRGALAGTGNLISSKVVQNLFDETSASHQVEQQPANLTRRELEILQLLVEGLSNREISSRLYLSEKTVKAHLAAVFRKLGVGNRTQAAMMALNLGLAPSPVVSQPDQEGPPATARA